MQNSFIKLYRKIQDNWIWENPLYLKCWLDMLMRASIKPSSALINEQVIQVNRGDIIFSQRVFCKRNSISRQKLRTLLKKMEKTKMISIKTNPNITHLSLNNYELYHSSNPRLTQSQPGANPELTLLKESNKERKKEFILFWNSYPKKVGKKKVQEKFLQNQYPIDDILKALEIHKQSDQWQNPQYIPNPETYLNQEKWNDILINNKDDEIVYIYHCKNCDKQKTTSEYRDLYVSCCDEQIQPTKEYK